MKKSKKWKKGKTFPRILMAGFMIAYLCESIEILVQIAEVIISVELQ